MSEAKVLFPGVHRKRPADRAGGCGRAAGRDRRTGVGAVLQFRRTAPAGAPPRAAAAAGSAATCSRHSSSRRRSGSQNFSRAPPPDKRDPTIVPGAQRAGARRRHGGLARLRPRGCLFRTAGHGRDPQAQDRLRPDQISAQGRAGRLGRRGQGHSRHREAGRHRRHARAQRPRRDPRTGGRQVREEERQEGRRAKTDAKPGDAKPAAKPDDAADADAKPEDKPADAEADDAADSDAPSIIAPEKSTRAGERPV